jgi:hypothetical protein
MEQGAKKLAKMWIQKVAKVEYRLDIVWSPKGVQHIAGVLRSFRDGKVRIANLAKVSDLGIKEANSQITVWSSQREELVKLAQWLEQRGYETSGVW